jgi:pSer/pThr/pTyr-binding forkhead associated (FHA) protein
MERLVLSWVNKPFAFELKPGLNRLGRNPTNDFRVADASVSGFHCEVLLEADNKVMVRDLASTNGTFVENISTWDGPLRVGQSLRLGSVEFRLETASVIESATEPEAVMAGGGENTQTWTDPKKPSILGRLTQTLRLPFGR